MYVIKNNFRESEWEYVELAGHIYLTKYLGTSTKIVFPKGDKFHIGLVGEQLPLFSYGCVEHYVEEVDFNYIDLSSTGKALPIPNSIYLRRLKNISKDVTEFSYGHFSSKENVIEIDFPEKFEQSTEMFAGTNIVHGVNFKGVMPTLYQTYRDARLLKDGGNIPDSVRTLDSTYTESGLEKGVDLSKTNVVLLVNTYRKCPNLRSSGTFNDKIYEMSTTYYGCRMMENVSRLPDSCTLMIGTFFGCIRMRKHPNMPKNLKIGIDTFSNCSLGYAKEIPYGTLSVKGMYALNMNLVRGTDVPNTVIDCSHLYRGCTKLQHCVNIGSSVITAENMYTGCVSITHAPDLPDNVKIADYMYADCYRLRVAPKLGKVVSIRGMFEGCVILDTASEIPETVEDVRSLFHGCRMLRGDIVVRAKNIVAAEDMFSPGDYHKVVYVDFNSKTYETFERDGIIRNAKKYNLEIRPLEEYDRKVANG